MNLRLSRPFSTHWRLNRLRDRLSRFRRLQQNRQRVWGLKPSTL